MTIVELAACVASAILANLRWWRVAQREHYLPGSVALFSRRWWTSTPLNALFAVGAVVSLVAALFGSPAVFGAAVVTAIGPLGLSLKGRTSPLNWTRRMKTVAATTAVLELVVAGAGATLGQGVFAFGSIGLIAPLVIDLALWVLAPVEKRVAQKFVVPAAKRMKMVAPLVVGITGSYGKTSTKSYVAHFLTGTKTVLATPASFNNRAGLSRAINEQLSVGTDVFIAEMGTYGRGEIAELCRLASPDIAMITAIGPVHLERFGNEDNVVAAKAEIFENAKVCVLNVDDYRLAILADKLEAEGRRVWRCGSANPAATVRVVVDAGKMCVLHDGNVVAEGKAPQGAPTNIACAVGVALELGVPNEQIAARLTSIPVAAHRQDVTVTPDGLVVIDDTYNANPASVRRGLELLRAVGSDDHRRIVVTPGMVELGPRQADENAKFATAAGEVATDIVIVGKTNRKALVEGARATVVNVITVDRLPEAVDWVRQHAGPGDAVLYANDLPDHFP